MDEDQTTKSELLLRSSVHIERRGMTGEYGWPPGIVTDVRRMRRRKGVTQGVTEKHNEDGGPENRILAQINSILVNTRE